MYCWVVWNGLYWIGMNGAGPIWKLQLDPGFSVPCLNSLLFSPVSSDFLLWCGFATKPLPPRRNMTERSVNEVI